MPNRDEAIQSIMASLMADYESTDLRKIESACYANLSRYDITAHADRSADLSVDMNPNIRAYQMFFVAKKIEGLSDKSLKVYKYTLDKFFSKYSTTPLAAITTNDVRLYLAARQGIKATTLNNERRHLASFFGWLFLEEYIPKNPMLKIKTIRQEKTVRKPFSGKEIEELRDACADKRERAIVEILLSTGMRVGELSGATLDNLSCGEIIVTGKGNKQRICYLNPTALKRMGDYLEERTDHDSALIRTTTNGKLPHNRVAVGRLEQVVREIGRRAGVPDTHPHRFRRTAATMALQRGMMCERSDCRTLARTTQ